VSAHPHGGARLVRERLSQYASAEAIRLTRKMGSRRSSPGEDRGRDKLNLWHDGCICITGHSTIRRRFDRNLAMPPMFALDDSRSSVVPSHERPRRDHGVTEPGEIIDGYRIVRLLGRGSMGVVFLAHDETLDRHVAIKFTDPNLTPSFRERFVEEARAMARVSHPNVLQVHAFGEKDATPYFVMEFVEGCTLEQWLREQPSPPDLDVALRILNELCLGVDAIHAQNTVHRDIKPSNILLDDKLRPRVADLGLAALRRIDQPIASEMVGTPAYMAPEIVFTSLSDPALASRSDVYSLACVAFELLTGRLPFDGTGNVGIVLQHAVEPAPAPSSLRPGLPEELDRALLHALAKSPLDRTASIEEFRRDLANARCDSLEPKRILVAEDHDDSRELLRLILAHEFPAAEIECVSDGAMALEAFNRKPPSVALLDLRLPGIDGMALTKHLRQRASSATMPIIVLTGSGGPDEWRMLSALGADRFLVKPVVADDVAASVRRALHERSSSVPQVMVA
jgi:eukaryotic-like serine/threonine-protein kinase